MRAFKRTLKKLLPPSAVERFRAGRELFWKTASHLTPKRKYRPGKYPAGVNLAGYVRAEMGLGQSCRCVAEALAAANAPFSVIDYHYGVCARLGDDAWDHKMKGIRYAANLTVVNADQMHYAIAHLGAAYWNGRYQIAHYVWELPEYPREWVKVNEIFDEIWTPSRFCTETISRAVGKPVYTIPYVVAPKITQKRDRAYFGLPRDRFLFLCMFDVNSVMERKNPIGVIRAFQKAFGASSPEAALVIKVNDFRGDPEARACLETLVRGCDNICLMDKILSRNDVNALIDVCDCFVSLHRSEGFGFVMAEAMYLGKPVIATNWSANTDYMDETNSCPVGYRLVPITADYGIYRKGQVWADPDESHCAEYMRRLTRDPEYRQRISREGRKTILEKYSAAAAAEAVGARLSDIFGEEWKAPSR